MDKEMDQYSLESDNEYTEKEKELLAKVRKARVKENFDSDDEVLGFGSSEEEEEYEDEDAQDSMEEDIEGLGEDEDMPDAKAWGNKKKNYYSTNFIDPDYSTMDEKTKTMAKIEEEEGQKIKAELLATMCDEDYNLELSGKQESKKEEIDFYEYGKQHNVEKDGREYKLLIADGEVRFTEAEHILKPFLKLAKLNKWEEDNVVLFINAKYQILKKYFVNLLFYIILKEKSSTHPVMKQLAQCRQLLAKFDEKQGNLLDTIKDILNTSQEKKLISINGISAVKTIPQPERTLTKQLKQAKLKMKERSIRSKK